MEDGYKTDIKAEKDLEVVFSDSAEISSTEIYDDYGGFNRETYDEIVHYLRDKRLPRRLNGHMKHRLDCFKRKAKRFKLVEGTDQLVYIGFKPEAGNPGQFVVKKGDVEQILLEAHMQTNHGGLNATRKMVSSKFYWNSITNDVENFIKRCPRCRVTRQRYVASNNVPWRKHGRFTGDIYGSDVIFSDGCEGAYRLTDGGDVQNWRVCRGPDGEEYVVGAQDIEINDVAPSKRLRLDNDSLSDNEGDAEEDSAEVIETKIDTQMFLPHYFRCKPVPPAYRRSQHSDIAEGSLDEINYEEQMMYEYGDPYYDEEMTDCNGEISAVDGGRLVVDGGYINSNTRAACAPAMDNVEKIVVLEGEGHRYTEEGCEYLIDTEKKYFMVDVDQLLQLFKRCPECGGKLKTITLSSDAIMPLVAYECEKCEPSVWLGQKLP